MGHFDPQNHQSFSHRYFISDKFYNAHNTTLSTIFIYCGGEGDIEAFWNISGLPFDVAPQFNALVVFVEHRYYGQSLPLNHSQHTMQLVVIIFPIFVDGASSR